MNCHTGTIEFGTTVIELLNLTANNSATTLDTEKCSEVPACIVYVTTAPFGGAGMVEETSHSSGTSSYLKNVGVLPLSAPMGLRLLVVHPE